MTKAIGRNDPCPCGSGKKYKHCCLYPDGAKEDHRDRGAGCSPNRHRNRYGLRLGASGGGWLARCLGVPHLYRPASTPQ
ncbi:MAG: SEC-C metal-binding domain-containing protein [Acidobacteriota bacterium]